jgi:hypothetical protein
VEENLVEKMLPPEDLFLDDDDLMMMRKTITFQM